MASPGPNVGFSALYFCGAKANAGRMCCPAHFLVCRFCSFRNLAGSLYTLAHSFHLDNLHWSVVPSVGWITAHAQHCTTQNRCAARHPTAARLSAPAAHPHVHQRNSPEEGSGTSCTERAAPAIPIDGDIAPNPQATLLLLLSPGQSELPALADRGNGNATRGTEPWTPAFQGLFC
ncbi:hypothetical protein C8R45DRAFT_1165264 [Mycena sanguinolenta]|nr:hypothetical protein C8R45DRAFT_1165264 [Mycena sanguinolenta]